MIGHNHYSFKEKIMIRCKLKKGVGFHIRKEPGKGTVRYQPGDIMKVKNISELGGAADKFEILDKIPEEKELQLDAPPVGLKMEHRGGGRYNVVNVETGEAVNEEHLTKKEAHQCGQVEQLIFWEVGQVFLDWIYVKGLKDCLKASG
jgi:hypothetical protein